MSKRMSHGDLAIAVGKKAPIVAVLHEATMVGSGYGVFFSDAPTDPTLDDCWTVCLHCLIERHPQVGRGLDLAKLSGAAELQGDRWVGG